MTEVFEVVFGCENCGDEWAQSYPPETRVGQDAHSSRRVAALDTTCQHAMGKQCGCREVLQCPTCELLDTVTIVDRRPLEPEAEADD